MFNNLIVFNVGVLAFGSTLFVANLPGAMRWAVLALVGLLIALVLAFRNLVILVPALEFAVIAKRHTHTVVRIVQTGFHLISPTEFVLMRHTLEPEPYSDTTTTQPLEGGASVDIGWSAIWGIDYNRIEPGHRDLAMRLLEQQVPKEMVKKHVGNILRRTVQGYSPQQLAGDRAQETLEKTVLDKVNERVAFLGIDLFNLTIDNMKLPESLETLLRERAYFDTAAQLASRRAELTALVEHIRFQTEIDFQLARGDTDLMLQQRRGLLMERLSEQGFERFREAGLVDALLEHGVPPSHVPVTQWARWFDSPPTSRQRIWHDENYQPRASA